MGTVLSFSPRERRPIYSTHHHSAGTLSSSNSADFPLNNYSYEQLNNAKNRESAQTKPPNLIQTKHSLFINALSWKRLAASHGKKKLDNNKNKSANLATATSFRTPLTDTIHPLLDKNKNLQQSQSFTQTISSQQLQQQQQQPATIVLSQSGSGVVAGQQSSGAGAQSVVGLGGSGAAIGLASQQSQSQQQQHHLHPQHGQMMVAQQQQQQQAVYFTPRGPKALLALDLVRANNTNPLSQPDKLAQKLPLQLPMPLQPIVNQQHNIPMAQQLHHGHGPRKTVIQVGGLKQGA
uniref:Uncharacterized protein n=1 Tax=Anopheles minimus TaxID=112268 RepID=A0A182VSI1_9DIPT